MLPFEITKISRHFFPIPSKSSKVESTTNPFMHSFVSCSVSCPTAESEPFSSNRVRPPLHPSDTLTIYAVISVLPSVLPHCIVWCGLHPNPYSPCDHLCSASDPQRVTPPLHPPPPPDHPCSHECPLVNKILCIYAVPVFLLIMYFTIHHYQ